MVHTAVKTIGSFAASTQVLNDIQKIIRWSQLTNLMGKLFTDCDQRDERQGWMGDAQATAEEAMMNFDMAAFYTNFIRDIADAQRDDGAVPDTVPLKYGSYDADLGWQTAYPLLVKKKEQALWRPPHHRAERSGTEEVHRVSSPQCQRRCVRHRAGARRRLGRAGPHAP